MITASREHYGTDRTAATQVVGEACLGVFDLVLVVATQLLTDLVDLPDSCRAYRVAFREQPAAVIDGDLAIDRGVSCCCGGRAFAFREEAKILGIADLR